MDLQPFDPTFYAEEALLTGDLDGGLAQIGVGYDEQVVIDPIFGKGFDDLVNEIRHQSMFGEPLSFDGGWRHASDVVDGYVFQDVPEGILLIAPDGEWAGGFLSADLAIKDEHQGQGLGAELVLEKLMMHGELPTWNHDEAGYTPAGEAAVRSARGLAGNRDIFERKAIRAVALELQTIGVYYGCFQPSASDLGGQLGYAAPDDYEDLVRTHVSTKGWDQALDDLQSVCDSYAPDNCLSSRP